MKYSKIFRYALPPIFQLMDILGSPLKAFFHYLNSKDLPEVVKKTFSESIE